jgi:hypothetical protein
VTAKPPRERRSEPSVTSAQRAGAAAVLRERLGLSTDVLIAVVDAAAWWIDQPGGHGYAASLLAAVARDADIATAALDAMTWEPSDAPPRGH